MTEARPFRVPRSEIHREAVGMAGSWAGPAENQRGKPMKPPMIKVKRRVEVGHIYLDIYVHEDVEYILLNDLRKFLGLSGSMTAQFITRNFQDDPRFRAFFRLRENQNRGRVFVTFRGAHLICALVRKSTSKGRARQVLRALNLDSSFWENDLLQGPFRNRQISLYDQIKALEKRIDEQVYLVNRLIIRINALEAGSWNFSAAKPQGTWSRIMAAMRGNGA